MTTLTEVVLAVFGGGVACGAVLTLAIVAFVGRGWHVRSHGPHGPRI